MTVKPPGTVSTSPPVVVVTVYGPVGVLAPMLMLATRLLVELTVTLFTVMPEPKLTVVVPWIQSVYRPVMVTFKSV